VLPLLALVLTACSAVGLLYNNADTFLYATFDKQLDFDGRQERQVKDGIDRFLAWHRREELPDYARLLREQVPRLAKGLTQEEVVTLGDAVNKRVDRALDHAVPEMTRIALTLSEAQLKFMAERYTKDIKQMREDMVDISREKQLEKRFDQLISGLERVYGSFNSEQRARLRAASDARPLNHAFLLAERLARQQDVLTTLATIRRDQPERQAANRLLRAMFARVFPSADRERREYFEKVNAGTAAAISLATQIATETQKQRARDTLLGWAADLEALAAKP
jgi:hypothetical protein